MRGDSTPVQESFDEMLEAAERKAWLERRACQHCFVTIYIPDANIVAVVCGHRCGTVKEERPSRDPQGDAVKAAKTREAFLLAHARGCPRRPAAVPSSE